jgi:hypothetical protein
MHYLWRAGFVICLLAGSCASRRGAAAVANSLVLNEVNTVSSTAFLDMDRTNGPPRNRGDVIFGRVEGNGQNWLEFLVVQGDELGGGAFANTLDLRGWKLSWSYDKPPATVGGPDPHVEGHGVMQFTNDPLWSAVPRGTLILISEWKQLWYLNAGPDPAGFNGLKRGGGINGLNEVVGDPYDAMVHTKLVDLSTNVRWNPFATTSDGVTTGTGDWAIRVWAGERTDDNSAFKYFNFSGEIYKGLDEAMEPLPPEPIGTSGAGLYAANNDNWQLSILQPIPGMDDKVIQGPVGEVFSGNSVGRDELMRLENFPTTRNPPATIANYLAVNAADYIDGTTSTYGKPNEWSSGAGIQDLAALRNWVKQGDANLDGRVDNADFLAWQRNVGATNASLTQGDFNGDAVVDAADLALWKTKYATALAAGAAVPECSGAAMALAACAAIAPLRRRRQGL